MTAGTLKALRTFSVNSHNFQFIDTPEIEDMLGKKVNLKLWVKVKKDWRDSDFLIKNFGYDKKEY